MPAEKNISEVLIFHCTQIVQAKGQQDNVEKNMWIWCLEHLQSVAV